jgi:DNA-binding NarL/FixJ family response regulator
MANGPEQVAVGPAAVYPILIIDDHELFAASLALSLRDQGYAPERAAVTGVGAILAQAAAGPVGLAVLDLYLGHDECGRQIDGAELVKALRNLGWRVLIVSGSRNQAREAAAIAAGAVGSVPKASSFTALLHAIDTAAAGREVMTDGQRADWLLRHRGYRKQGQELARRLDKLSRREREVLELLAQGYKAGSIAERFVVSMTTVRTQIRSILTKLEVNSQLEAVALISRQRGG